MRDEVDHLVAAFEESRKAVSKREEQLAQEVERLTGRLARKDEVTAAVTSEMVSLKKELGEPRPTAGLPTTSAIPFSNSCRCQE